MPQKSRLSRIREVIFAFRKYGLGWLVLFIRTPKLIDEDTFNKRLSESSIQLRELFENLGPTFIKLGQILSTQRTSLPKTVINELAKLQDCVNPLPFETIKPFIEKELNGKVNNTFLEINENPIASASIGQVYEATLLNGEKVIFKIQKPNVAETIELDLKIIYPWILLLERNTKWGKEHKPLRVFDELKRNLSVEVNYIKEAENCQKISEELKEIDNIHIPKIYWTYTTQRLLVMEAVYGTKVDNINELKQKEIDLKKCADILIEAYLKQILDFSFYHADPHPGNIAIDDNGIIILYDFGMVGSLSKYNKNLIILLLVAILREDIDRIAEIIVEMGKNDFIDESFVEREINKLLIKYYRTALREISVVDVMEEVFKLANEVNLTLSPEFLLLGKCLIELEGIVTLIVPDVNFENLAEEHIYKYIWKDILDIPSFRQVFFYFLDIRDFITELPKRLNSIIRKFENGSNKSSIDFKTQKAYKRTANTFLFITFWGILFFAIIKMIEIKLSLSQIVLFSLVYVAGLMLFLIFSTK